MMFKIPFRLIVSPPFGAVGLLAWALCLTSCFDQVPSHASKDDSGTESDSAATSSGDDTRDDESDGGAFDSGSSDTGGVDGESSGTGGEETGSEGQETGTEDAGSDVDEGSESDSEDDGDTGSTDDNGSTDDGGNTDGGGSTDDGGSDSGDQGSDSSGSSDEGSEASSDDGPEPPDPCPSQTHVCTAVPSGWQGPVALAERSSGQSLPTCSGSYGQLFSDTLFSQLDAPDAECSCNCSTPSPTCSLSLIQSTQCNADFHTIALQDNECEDFFWVGNLSAPTGLEIRGQVVSRGSCIASLNTDVDPPSWGARGRICEFTGTPLDADCAAGEACMPLSSPAFGSRTCIYRSGRHACPSPYAETQNWFLDQADDIPDDRRCSGCSCGTATGAVCGGVLSVFRNEDTGSGTCTSTSTNFEAGDGCSLWPGDAFESFVGRSRSSVEDPGSCSATGGTPLGEAIPEKQFTVCCL